MKIYDVAIIGGGFSGLISAEILSSKLGADRVILFEKKDRVGKKILATGNGRGNITNLDLTVEKYHSQSGANISKFIKIFGNKSIINYFRGLGVDVSTEEGKVYPSSFQANSILDAIRLKLDYLSANVNVDEEVFNLKKEKGIFKISTAKGEYYSNLIIFACGGKAGKQFGTDGTAYKLLENFGHTVTPLYPSLVQLKTDTAKIKGLKGLKQQAMVSAIVNGKQIASFNGDVLFTEFGVSGNAIFYLSAYLSGEKNGEISISFLPDKTEEEIACFIVYKFENLPYLTIEDCLTGIINKQIGKAIIKDCGNLNKNYASALKIARKIKDFRLEFKGTLGFDNAQVTKGGIPFTEVDGKTLESKKVKGLHIVGEAIDVDGDCGGYNLQWAYSSARAVCCEVEDKYGV